MYCLYTDIVCDDNGALTSENINKQKERDSAILDIMKQKGMPEFPMLTSLADAFIPIFKTLTEEHPFLNVIYVSYYGKQVDICHLVTKGHVFFYDDMYEIYSHILGKNIKTELF
jgi:hypothetical protein